MNAPEKHGTVTLAFSLPADQVDELDDLAKESGTTRNELINQAIDTYLEEHEKDDK